ncbi:MAG: hypothetical protein AAGN15_01130 [Cyanobacteria bacterium J06581_3]
MNNQLRRIFTAAAMPAGLALLGLGILTPSAKAETLTVCEYDSSLGFEDPLNSGDAGTGQATIMVTNVDGVTAFNYSFQPSQQRRSDDGRSLVFNNPQLSVQKSLTFFDTTLESARQQMLENPEYYAELIDATVEGLQGRGYELVDRTLTCREENATRDPEFNSPAPTSQPTFDNLPDGNYRVTSTDLPFRVVTAQELLESEGTVFLFKKIGDTVSGDFFYPETDASVCIEGTLSGDTVRGRGRLEGTEGTVPDSDALSVDDIIDGQFLSAVVLDLSNFSRINAGTVLPRRNCDF